MPSLLHALPVLLASLFLLSTPAMAAEDPPLRFTLALRIQLQILATKEGSLSWREDRQLDLRPLDRKGIAELAKSPLLFLPDHDTAPFIEVSGVVYTPSGAIRRRPLTMDHAEITCPDAFMGSCAWYSFDLTDGRSPIETNEIVRLTTRRDGKDLAFLPHFPIPLADSLEFFELVVNAPPDVDLEWLASSAWQGVTCVEERPGPGQLIIRCAPRRGFRSLPFHGPDQDLAVLTLTPRIGGRSLVPDEPRRMCDWYAGMADLAPVLAADIPADLRSALEGITGTQERLDTIHGWISRHFRYLFDASEHNGLVPAAPDNTLATRYGDCKALSSLLVALARREGQNLHLALVSTEPRMPELCRPGAYDHMIAAWNHNGNWLFADPTSRASGFGSPVPELHGRRVLVLDPAGPQEVTYNVGTQAERLYLRLHGHLDSLKTATGELVLTGSTARRLRLQFETGTDLDRENLLSGLVGSVYESLRLQSFVESPSGPDTLRYVARADASALLVTGKRGSYLRKFPISGFGKEGRERAMDTEAFLLGAPLDAWLEMELLAPALPDLHRNVDIGEPGRCGVHGQLTVTAGRLRYESGLRLPGGPLEGPDLENARTLLRDMHDQRSSYLTLGSTE